MRLFSPPELLLAALVVILVGCTPGPLLPPTVTSTINPASRTPQFSTPTFLPTSTSEPTETPTLTPEPLFTRFAVIGDYGSDNSAEADVAALIRGWKPDFILTTGDNNYPSGAADTLDANVGRYFHDYIFPYAGAYGSGADLNHFFPALGNHDWITAGAQPYLDYFTLPGNERYYDYVWGPVHFFVLDSDEHEPDGINAGSEQAAWLQRGLAASTSAWNIICTHYPPYSSGVQGSIDWMRWPYAAWGADALLAGHDHLYERLLVDGIPYFTNGAGGGGLYNFGTSLPESKFRYNANYGAMLVTASPSQLLFEFYNRVGDLIDSLQLAK